MSAGNGQVELALWANRVQRKCLEACNGNLEAAVRAAENIIATETPESMPLKDEPTPSPSPPPPPPPPPNPAALAVDVKETGKQTDSILRGIYKRSKPKRVAKMHVDSVLAEMYPRDRSNRFLDKRRIANYAASPERDPKFRDSIPEEQRPKLDRIVAQLQGGGTVHRPDERPELAVNMNGSIADSEWEWYDWRTNQAKEWRKRDKERSKRRKRVDAATKVVRDPDHVTKLGRAIDAAHSRSADTPVGELRDAIADALGAYGSFVADATDALEGIASEDAEVRALARAQADFERSVRRATDDYVSEVKRSDPNIAHSRYRDLVRTVEDGTAALHRLFEDIIEEAHKRLDEEHGSDPEPVIPDEPLPSDQRKTDTGPMPFSLEDARAEIALAVNMTWSPYVGPRGGKGWKSSTGVVKYGSEKPGTRGEADERTSGPRRKGAGVSAPVGGGGRAAERGATPVSSDMATAAQRPRSEEPRGARPTEAVPAGAEARSAPPEPLPQGARRGPAQRAAVLATVDKEMRRYASHFRDRAQPEVAEWFDELRQHIQQVGPDRALRSISHYEDGSAAAPAGAPTDKLDVQYVGTGYFKGDPNLKFLKDYLDDVGITFISDYRSVKNFDKKKRLIASAPVETAKKVAKEGDLIATGTNIQTKLEESKLLPGLESTEDIHKVVGQQVTQFTPDVISKLDEAYGRGKWIVKSYGDEAYAGFGIFFPQRVKQIRAEAKQVIAEAGSSLKKRGWALQRGEDGTITGISGAGQTYSLSNKQYEQIEDEKVKRLARQVASAAPQERGARLPVNSEVSAQQDYGVTLQKDKKGKVTAIVDEDGTVTPTNSPEYDKLYEKWDDLKGYYIDKLVTAVNDGYATGMDTRFMVQPAFKAVGVSEMDRALGFTWETSNEGRVHVSTKGGKASVIPYSTMANRSDAFPVIFPNDDIRAMEKAVQDALDALPESEKQGQVYAPDVMKTTQGWRVVELNAASEFGQSMWLEENPFVIDAYVSHLTGRKPAHANFITSLLQGKAVELGLKGAPARSLEEELDDDASAGGQHGKVGGKIGGKGPALSTDAQGHEHRGRGPGGGQFVKKGGGGASTLKKLDPERNRADQTKAPGRPIKKVGGPGGPVKTITSAVAGAVRGALIAGKAAATGKPEMVSREEHQAAVQRALRKWDNVVPPTAEEVAENQAGLEEHGAQHYRRNLVGNSGDRRRRREKIMREFGDGVSCPCVYCGVVLRGDGDLEQDKMFTTAEGGRYRMSNLVPSCTDCNKRRSDMTFPEAMETVVRYAGDA